MVVKWRTLGLGALVCGALACGDAKKPAATNNEPGKPDDATSAPPPMDTTGAPLHEQLGVKLIPVAPAADIAPQNLLISAARPILRYNRQAIDTARTVLTFDPPIEGKLGGSESSSIVFTPTTPFVPGKTYKVSLSSLQALDDTARPPTPWTTTFTVPAIKLLKLERAVPITSTSLAVELVFSGPVSPESIAQVAKWSVADTSISRVTYQAITPHRVRATLSGPNMERMRPIVSLKLAEGVLSDAGAALPEATVQTAIIQGKPLEILSVRREDSATGTSFVVTCDDKSVEERHEFWDDETSEERSISDRCVFDAASARDLLHIYPAVEHQLVPNYNGFRIEGKFGRGAYTIALRAGLTSEDGGVLDATHEQIFEIPPANARLQFAYSGRYMPRDVALPLELRSLNASNLHITVRHIPRANLIFWLSGEENATERTSDLLGEQTLALKAMPDQPLSTNIYLKQMVADLPAGVFEVNVSDEAGQANDSARVVRTDMQLIVKQDGADPDASWRRRYRAWVIGAHDSAPLPGVELELVRPSGTVLTRCLTDLQGSCALAVEEEPTDKTPPMAIIATRGDDFTYVKFDELEATINGNGWASADYRSSESYNSALYSDRDLYRPGEDVHLSAVLRDVSWQASAATPTTLEIFDARGRLITRRVKDSSAVGLINHDLALDDFAPTGSWRAQLKVGNKIVSEHRFSVEEFVPERMRVRVTPRAKEAAALDAAGAPSPVVMDVDAAYLFGASADGSIVDATCRIAPTSFTPKAEHERYSFGRWSEEVELASMTLGEVTARVNEMGKAEISCPIAQGTTFDVPATVTTSVSVLEAGSGRATRAAGSTTLHPERFYIGLRAPEGQADITHDTVIAGVLLDWKGELVRDVPEVELEVNKLIEEYGSVKVRGTSYASRRWYRRPEKMGELVRVPVKDGQFSFTFRPDADAASFLVRAHSGRAITDVEIDGAIDAWRWWGYARYETARPDTAEIVAITAPDAFQPDKPAPITFTSPFAGRALLSLETDRVLHSEWRDVVAGPNTWEVMPLTMEFVPNIYANVLVVKDPHTESKQAWLPGRANGRVSIPVRTTTFTQQVAINAPKEVLPEGTLTVTVDLGGAPVEETWATVAVVDQGVLSLTRFVTPDVAAYIFTARTHAVSLFETIGWGIQVPISRTGGGDEMDDAESEQKAGAKKDGKDKPLGRLKAIRPVALWSGPIKIGADGKASVPFKLPLFRGALRVMVHTTGKQRLGRAEAEVLVRAPLNLQTSTPRILSGGDRVEVPVFLSNLSGKSQQVTLAATVQPTAPEGEEIPKDAPAKIVGESSHSVTLEDGKSITVPFVVEAIAQSGGVKLIITAKGQGTETSDESVFPIQPAAPRERLVTQIALSQGDNDLAQALAGWVPTSERTTFWVTAFPFGEAMNHLSYLIRYPYGCLEQTISATRPMLYLGKLLGQLEPSLVSKTETIAVRVERGIRRILAMQTPGGGFATWPGSTTPDPWGTAYAVHFLRDAQAQGFDVPRERVDHAIEWLEQNAAQPTNILAEPYIQYVLAIAGKGQKARVRQLLTAFNAKMARGPRAEQTYLLQAALYKLGDQRYLNDLRSPTVDDAFEAHDAWSIYYSDRRRRALTLSVYIELFGKDDKIEPLARRVAQDLSGGYSYYYTTQEIGWATSALGKWFADAAQDWGDAALLLDGKPWGALPGGEQGKELTWDVPRASEYKSATLKLGRKGAGKLYLLVSSEGARVNPSVKPGSKGLALRVETLNQQGAPINADTPATLGELRYQRIVLTNLSGRRLDDLALVWRTAAGLEIENPRLGQAMLPDALKDRPLWSPAHMNVRDDRVEYFGSVASGQSVEVIVAVRAASPGAFVWPAASAEAMYDPSVFARLAPVKLSIEGRAK
jgi:alpha-2-macroglobulin